jgi:hypothetical protein
VNLDDVGWPHFVTVVVTAMVVVAAVLVHYEGLNWSGRLIKRRFLHHRAKILMLIFAELGLHIAEIWLFAAGYAFLTVGLGYGAIVPATPLAILPANPTGLFAAAQVGFLDVVYFSAINFTTVGFGDLVPLGLVRFLSGTEALTGFVLITWSASFTFLEMQRYWGKD